MKNFFVEDDFFIGAHVSLDAEETHHAAKVLRCHKGDEALLMNGKGLIAKAVFIDISKNKSVLKIHEILHQLEPKQKIQIALANLKNRERMEWFTEKAAELGAAGIHFFKADHSEKMHLNEERLRKILISALKQSGNAWLPKLHIYSSTKMLLDNHFEGELYLAHCETDDTQLLKNAYTPNANAIVLIGPEGDFSAEEIELAMQKGFKPVNLGPLRLRAETAALTALLTLQVANY